MLDRISFGPRPGEVAQVEAIGIDRYLQQQLNPTTLPESPPLQQRLAPLETLRLSPPEILRQFTDTRQQIRDLQQRQQLDTATVRSINRQTTVVNQQAQQAKVLRSLYSNRQLEEVMVDFWYNHFNVSIEKGLSRLWAGDYEQRAIRPYALGQFRQLLGATAYHPAMQYYLDNWRNTAPESPGARGAYRGLNENYARELMELHTLGVEGGYSQQDVTTLARIFTGWGFCQESTRADGFCFEAQRHDASAKVFLGQAIAPGGLEQGEQALDLLANSPATAAHISYKLAQYFVADDPPQALVNRLAQKFLATEGNIRQVLLTLFQSPEFWDSQALNAKFKTPFQFVISSLRALNLPVKDPSSLLTFLNLQGMPVYGCESPQGYPNTEIAWLSSDAMLRRLSWATSLTRDRPLRNRLNGQPPAANLPPVNPNELAQTLGSLSAETRDAIATSPPNLKAALLLSSPEWMYR